MASSINASTSGAGGVITTADNTGNLNIQSGGSTVLALTSSGVAITGTLSATTISGAGGTTLLGTLTTTSGTTQTLSGLSLTNYKLLQITFNNVGFTSGSATELQVAGVKVTASTYAGTGTAIYGIMTIDLSNGAVGGNVLSGYIPTGSTNTIYFNAGSNPIAGNIQILNATTSIAFAFAAGNTFTNGTIKVYGVA